MKKPILALHVRLAREGRWCCVGCVGCVAASFYPRSPGEIWTLEELVLQMTRWGSSLAALDADGVSASDVLAATKAV